MPELSKLFIFAATTFIVAITPWPDQIYIATRNIAQGRNAGLALSLGIYTGILIYIIAVALGLSALLAASPLAFTVMKYLGAAYLIYLGVSIFLANTKVQASNSLETVPKQALSKIYIDGIIINLLFHHKVKDDGRSTILLKSKLCLSIK